MKTLIWYGAIAVVLGVAATISGQSEIANDSNSSSSYIQTSKLVGRKIKSSDGKEIGIVKDVVIDRINGCMAYTVVSTGGAGTGVISGGGKFVAIPWAVYSPTSDLSVLTVNVDRDKIYHAPAFEYTRMDEIARPDYINNVYSYYGVSSGPRTAIAAGTDVTGTAGATASPGEAASPAAGGTGSPNEKPSARAYPGFDRLSEGGDIQLAACWAHSRRRFYEVQQATASPIAAEALRRIAELYAHHFGVCPLCANSRHSQIECYFLLKQLGRRSRMS